ncbi:MAG: Slp family lipoprotein [Pseudomonadota bacterium]|jgi:outer membrane lipoprotein|nr:Slp family lipoprotein [Pseudomonadota bacterium]
MQRSLLVLILLLLSGCASIPSDLRSPPDQPLLAFSAAATTPPRGQAARWGGEIAQVSNLQQGSRLEVVQFPLNASGRPLKSDKSGGRFRILTPGFIDPVVYAPGRLVTALGTFAGVQQGRVGEQDYPFPLLEADQIHLWPEIKDPPLHCDCDPFFNSPLMLRPVIIVPANNK